MEKLEIQSDAKPFTMVKNAILDSEDILNEHEKLLYIILLRYGNKAFPSLSTLSKKCGFSKRTAQRTIDMLIKKGLLKKKNRTNKKTGNTSNIYILIDNDDIWYSSKENLKENIETMILEEAVKIVEDSGMKILGKTKGLASDTYQRTETSTYVNNININKDTTKEPESQAERYTLDQIRQLFDYDAMVNDDPYKKQDIDSVMDILHNTINTTKPMIRVAGENRPSMVVISKLMKLNKDSIMYAIKKFSEQTDRIQNPTSYMLTILYMALEQFNLDIRNQVSYNMANWDAGELGHIGQAWDVNKIRLINKKNIRGYP